MSNPELVAQPCDYCGDIDILGIDVALPSPLDSKSIRQYGFRSSRFRLERRNSLCENCIHAEVALYHLCTENQESDTP